MGSFGYGNDKLKRISVLGSTGSVGRQALDVIRNFPSAFSVVGLAAGYNVDMLIQQIEEFQPAVASCLIQDDRLSTLSHSGCQMVSQSEVASLPEADIVIAASVGTAALGPIVSAIKSGKTILLGNKESIVMAGKLIMSMAESSGASIRPVDSEPSAIWQCLRGENKEISKVIITASGGPFRQFTKESLEKVTALDALNHPTWVMGRKITVDSATLMNKGLEVIETHWLFDIPWQKIDVVVHPQSIIHALVEFVDGSMKAQLSPPDMRMPIQHALFYPNRSQNPALPKLSLIDTGALTFEPMDIDKYPCFGIALAAGQAGGTYPAVLSAADEVAVEMFLSGKIGFTTIPVLLESVLAKHKTISEPTLDEIMGSDTWARATAREWPI